MSIDAGNERDLPRARRENLGHYNYYCASYTLFGFPILHWGDNCAAFAFDPP
jgi:hypothetical protein